MERPRQPYLDLILGALKDLGSLALLTLLFMIAWIAIASALNAFLNMNIRLIFF